ncbi:TPA: ImmA/IrrE family metallo-endopeptidase [Streptococcus pyogenes]|nr:ImmA/IrrE family metallo-endopeptidase [Streptococcus pyogenes]
MTIEEILDFHNVELAYFDNELWPRPGIYIDEIKVVFVNRALSDESKKKVILHELGHIEHDPKQYQRLLLKYENQADRFMIRELIKNYLSSHDVVDFNWLQFATTYQISTTWGQQMIQEEFQNIVGV